MRESPIEAAIGAKINFHGIQEHKVKKTLGYVCLALSILIWVTIAILPFVGVSLGELAAGATALVVFAEVLFWASVTLLGKEAWARDLSR